MYMYFTALYHYVSPYLFMCLSISCFCCNLLSFCQLLCYFIVDLFVTFNNIQTGMHGYNLDCQISNAKFNRTMLLVNIHDMEFHYPNFGFPF